MNEPRGGDPRDVFRGIGAGEPGEIDSRRMWRRLEAALSSESRDSATAEASTASGSSPATAAALPGSGRYALAAAAAAVVVVSVGVWAGVSSLRYDSGAPRPASGDTTGELVLLAPPATLTPVGTAGMPATRADDPSRSDELIEPGPTTAAPRFEIRLVTGYEGAPPADALSAAADGAGGVDRLADVEGTLRAVLPQERFALVGEWSGTAEPGATSRLRLSDRHSVEFTAEAHPDTGSVTLRNMRLITDGRSDAASSVALQPGALYLFGAARSGGAHPTLALAIRLLDASE